MTDQLQARIELVTNEIKKQLNEEHYCYQLPKNQQFVQLINYINSKIDQIVNINIRRITDNYTDKEHHPSISLDIFSRLACFVFINGRLQNQDLDATKSRMQQVIDSYTSGTGAYDSFKHVGEGSTSYGRNTPEGYGFLLSKSKNQIGFFRNGNLSGPGMQSVEGHIDEGIFKCIMSYSVLSGWGRKIYPNVQIEEGMYVKDKLTGGGKISFNDGSYVMGEFTNGEMNGYGEIRMKNGDVGYGDFMSNNSWTGVKRCKDGREEKGKFTDYMLVEKEEE